MLAKLCGRSSPSTSRSSSTRPGETFRDELYAEYKANRAADARRAAARSSPYIRRLVAALRLPVIEEPGVEADDVIGTLADAGEPRRASRP